VITYDYPLNERIRTLLRLEDLFERTLYFAGQDVPESHHIALLTLFGLIEVAGRADLKMDMVQELERQRQSLMGFRNNPDISEDALSDVLSEIEQASAALLAMQGKTGQYLRENEWLMSIKNRAGIPGGVCEFDLPAYHFWLNRDAEQRQSDISSWVNPLLPIRDGLMIVLRLLRSSGHPERQVALRGAFQQMLSGRTAQLIRLRVSKQQAAVPEISANKYALNIRFTVPGTDMRPKQSDLDVDFELTYCNL
jgi:cell division protein ZapD